MNYRSVRETVIKYFAMLNIQIQNSFQYRGQLFFWIFSDVLFVVVLFFVWQAIFQQQETVGNYTFAGLITYYIISFVIRSVASSHVEFSIEGIVRDGRLSKYLFRPISFFWYRWMSDIGWKLSRFFASIPIYVLILLFLSEYLVLPDFKQGILFLIALFFSSVMYFFISYLISYTAFWMLKINSVVNILRFTLISLLAGSLIPLDLFPSFFEQLNRYLPFRYLVFFPIRVYLGEVKGESFWIGIGVMFLWFLFLSTVIWYLWKPAIKRYESVGG